MADVFISYTHEDMETARRFAQAIELQGLSVWWDQTIHAGEAYDEVTEAELRAARVVVVLWSSRSVASRWVRSEATLAQRLGKMAPVMIERCERPVAFELVQSPDLSTWTGDAEYPGFRAFAQQLRVRVTGDAERMSPVELATGAPMTLPSKPSIAVMPLADLGGSQDDHFADGLTEELSISLSSFSSLFVIAGQSSEGYRNSSKPARRIAEELGVRFLLEGSVRRAGRRIRVAARLVDAIGGEQVWAERFDEEADDLFGLQERIAASVASSIDSTIADVEFRRVMRRPPQSPTAYDLATHAHLKVNAYTREAVLESLDLSARAIALDPDYGWAHAIHSVAHGVLFLNDWADDRDAARARALEHGRRAIGLDPQDELVLSFAAGMMMNVGADLEDAARLADRAMEINPNKASVLFWAAWTDVERGDAARGLDRFERALRRNPKSRLRPFMLTGMGNCLHFLGRHREAVVVQSEAVRLLPDYPPANLILAASLHALGERGDARRTAAEVERTGGLDQALFYFRNREQRKQLRTAWSAIHGSEREAA